MSALPATNCPRCNSEQKFIPKLRPAANDQPWLECYIKCAMCRWENIIDHTTPEIDTLTRKLHKMQRRAEWEESRHGMCSTTLASRIDATRAQLARLREALFKRIVEADGTAPHPNAA